MKAKIFLIFFILLKSPTHSQSFLTFYKKYRLEKASAISTSKTRKKIRHYIKSHIIELDTIFKSYRAKTNFDFNKADTLFFIYQAPAESPFTGDVVIWSSKDTICYEQGFKMINPYKYKRIITYIPINPAIKESSGYAAASERDSLISLVAKRNYETINHLGDNQNISDGSYVSIYVAYKNNGSYKIESCSPPKFFIETRYIKEL